tara:strand:+ start:2697 stop:3794 length:1098 start_codon:yes stop_codon:yes gene_type:complete
MTQDLAGYLRDNGFDALVGLLEGPRQFTQRGMTELAVLVLGGSLAAHVGGVTHPEVLLQMRWTIIQALFDREWDVNYQIPYRSPDDDFGLTDATVLQHAIHNMSVWSDDLMPFIDAFLRREANVDAHQRNRSEQFQGGWPGVFAPPIVLALRPGPAYSRMLTHPALPLLLEYGADVNVRCSSVAPQPNAGSRFHRWTPLMWAVWLSELYGADYRVARALLDAGADPQLSDCDGSTPLTLTLPSEDYHQSLVKLLCKQPTAALAPIPPPECEVLGLNVETDANRQLRRKGHTRYLIHVLFRFVNLRLRSRERIARWLLYARERCWAPPGSEVYLHKGTENETKVEKPEGGKCYRKLAPEARERLKR